MSPFEVLGVARNADEATIKRAYAKALKSNRPEDDPAAFQTINDAYQSALEVARQRLSRIHGGDSSDEVAVIEREPPPPMQPVATQAPPPNRPALVVAADADAGFDYTSFVQQVHALCNNDSPRKLEQWLNSVAALYRIDRKTAVGDTLFRQWLEAATSMPLSMGHAHVLSNFFDRDFQHVVAIAKHSRARDELEDAIARERMRSLGTNDSSVKVLRQLKRRPFRRWQAILATIDGRFAGRVTQLAHRIAHSNGGTLPASINPEQAQFMEMLANPYYEGRWRWLSLLLRSTVIAGGIGMMLGLAIVFLHLRGAPGESLPEGVPSMIASMVASVMAMVMAILWTRQGVSWIRLHEEDKGARTGPISRWLPVWLAAVALMIALTPILPMFAAYLLLGLATAAMFRNWFSYGELAAMSVAFAMMLAPHLAPDAPRKSLMVYALALAVVVHRCSEIVIARYRGVPLARSGDNRIITGIAAAIFGVAMLLRL